MSNKQHVVIDGRIIETSTGRYVQRIVEGLNDDYAETGFRYTLLVPTDSVSVWQQRLPHFAVVAADQGNYSIAEQTSLWWQLRQLRPDLVHFMMPQQPVLWWGRSLTTVHDITLLRFENISGKESSLLYHLRKRVFAALLRLVVWRSQAIITPTEYSRQDIADYFGQKYLDKTFVTPLAGEIPDVEPEPVATLQDTQYVLFVGNAFPYKNVKRLILAHQQLRGSHPNLQLALAGRKDEFYDELEDFCRAEQIEGVHFLGFISDSEKRWLYQHAAVFATASLAEGFCMPILESMIEGCPVVAADASCLPEVVSDAGLLFNPHSTAAATETIGRVLDDPALRRKLVKNGAKHAASYSWSRTIRQTYEIYQSAKKH